MEAAECWLNILTRAWENEEKESLARILGDTCKYLKNVPDSKKDAFIQIVLDDKLFDKPITELFDAIRFLVQSFGSHCEPYAMQIRDMCFNCLKTCPLPDVKKSAAETLAELIKLCKTKDLQLNKIIEYYKDDKMFYVVIDAIAQYCPELECMINLSDLIFLNLLYAMKGQAHLPNRKRNPQLIKIYIQCLSSMMDNFVPFQERTETKYTKKLHTFCSELCEFITSKEVVTDILTYIMKHHKHFSSFIFENYKKWHISLHNANQDNPGNVSENNIRLFYKIIPQLILKEDKESVFEYFNTFFTSNLKNGNIAPTLLSITIYGLGYLSPVYVKYKPDELNIVFQAIHHQTSILLSKGINVEDIRITSDILQALSEIINQLSVVTFYHINSLIQLSIFEFKIFPKLNASDQTNTINTLKVVFDNVQKQEKIYQKQYFQSLFYQAILISCSHPLSVDIQLEQDVQNFSDYSICYKNYLPFWHAVFRENYQKEEFKQEIFADIILILTSFIDRINFNIKIYDNKFSTDATLRLKTENDIDFRYFLNLVDLFEKIVEDIDITLLQNHIEKLLVYFIKYSYKNPLISGFYKFVNTIIKKLNPVCNFEKYLNEYTNELIIQYLTDILKSIGEFSDELQLSCIYLIFNTPLHIVKKIVFEIIPVFKVAFRIGVSNFSLALRTIEVLEIWTNKLENQCLNDFRTGVVIYLEPYVSLEDSLSATDEQLKTLQKKILHFYGTIDTEVIRNFIMEKPCILNQKESILSLEQCFNEAELKINFYKLIRRIIKIINDEDRSTRFVAVELLQTIFTYILGKKLVEQYIDEHLCIELLKFTSNPDVSIRNIFCHLITKLIQYLSTKSALKSNSTEHFIDALFQGLSDDTNSLLRDYSGIFARCFVYGMLKQSPDADISKSPIFISILKRIIDFALYPANNKRVAAAIVFNNLYEILRNFPSVINTYWLEFLYGFVKSLEGCNDLQIVTAINNVESVTKLTSNMLNAKSPQRRKPSEFSTETLEGAVKWLFTQCGSVKPQFRHKCVALFENLCLLVNKFQTVAKFFSLHGKNYINSLCATEQKDNCQKVTIANAKVFLECLNYYTWIFDKKFILPENCFIIDSDKEKTSAFFTFFKQFVSLIVEQKTEEIISASTSTLSEAQELIDLINLIIWSIFKFILAILCANESHLVHVIETFWSDELFSLIYQFTLYPRKIGITVKTLQVIEPKELKKWFEMLQEKLPKSHLLNMQKNFFSIQKEDLQRFVSVDDFLNWKNDILDFKDFVRGLNILRKSQFFKDNEQEIFTNEFSIKTIKEISEALQNIEENRALHDARKVIAVKDYFVNVVEFLLLDYKYELVKFLLDFIKTGLPNSSVNESTMKKRHLFYDAFKTPILRCILRNPSQTLDLLLTVLEDSPDEIYLLYDLVKYADSNRSDKSTILATELIQRFDEYKGLIGNDARHNDLFFNIYRIAVILDCGSTDEDIPFESSDGLFGWIRKELEEAPDLERKSYILESFLTFISESSDLSLLDNLREENVKSWLEKLNSNDVERMQAVLCLQVLFKQLAVCKSPALFEGIVTYAAGACKLLLTKRQSYDYLKNYFAAVPEFNAWISIDTIYRIFMYETLSTEKRLDLLDYFLIPSLECCPSATFFNFYKHYVRDLSALLELQSAQDTPGLQNMLVKAIGGYRMFELMFGRASFGDALLPENDELLASFLTRQAMGVRSFTSVERELARLLHCAALNCLIAVVCARDDGRLCRSLLAEDAQWPLWRWIVDCGRVYDLGARPMTVRDRPINVMKTIDDGVVEYHLSPIDPARIGSDEWRMEVDPRKSLTLEEDELNEHECAAALTGLILCFHERRELGDPAPWLESFAKAFDKEKNNVNLLLMRVMSNAREAFLPHLTHLFDDLLFAVRLYLSRNPLNYLIGDVLSMLVESEYQLSTEADVEAAQDLLELLILRASSAGSENYECNVKLIESLVMLWKESLLIPRNLDSVLKVNHEFALRLFLILIRNLEADNCKKLIEIRAIHALVRKAMFRWKDPGTDRTYETLGWIMRYIEDHQRDVLVKEDIVDLFVDMQRCNKNLCARYAYLTFLGCPSLAHRKELRPFVNPRLVDDDERKAECFEIFLHAMDALSSEAVLSRLEESGLKGLLRDRVLPCVSVGLKIIKRVTKIARAKELLSYVEILELYTNKDIILEYKSVAYEIFTDVFYKYTHNMYIGDEEAERLVKICQRVLINGISGWSSEIQSKLLDIWRHRIRCDKTPSDRLLHLFNLYSPELHSSFAQFFCLLVLDLEKTSSAIEKGPQPNSGKCEIDTVPNLRATRSSIPMFASSLTGLLEQTMINNLCTDGESSSEANWTLIQMLSPKSKSKKKEPNFRKTLEGQEKCTSVYDFFLRLKEEKEDERNNVKIRQKYKINSHSDLEIALSNIIVTLDNLVRRDRLFADLLAPSLVHSILKNVYSVQYSEIIDVITKTCCLALEEPNDFAPTAMEILFGCNCNKFNANDVMQIANSMGLQSLGILLLEKDSINLQTPSSHSRAHHDTNLPLAIMYQSIGDRDMVKSIFKNWTVSTITNPSLRQGFLAELENDWISAKSCYEETFQIEEYDKSVKDYCLEGMFRCFTELSSWQDITKKVDAILDKNYDSVWQDSRKKNLVPWIFLAHSQKILDDISSDKTSDGKFIDSLKNWLLTRSSTILKTYGEETSIFFVCNENPSVPRARSYLKNCLESVREQWSRSCWLTGQSSFRAIEKIRRIDEMNRCLRTLESTDVTVAAQDLMRYWQGETRELAEDLKDARKLVDFRVAFANILIEKLKDASGDNEILQRVAVANIKQRLKICNLAIERQNKTLVRKHIMRIEKILGQLSDEEAAYVALHRNFEYEGSRVKFMYGEAEVEPEKKFIYYVDSWQLIDCLMRNEGVESTVRSRAMRHAFDVTVALHELMLKNPSCLHQARNNEFIIEILAESPEQFGVTMPKYSFQMLKNACGVGCDRDRAESYVKFADYCLQLLPETYDRNSQLQEELITSVLTAMALGSVKAIRYFPSLLKYSINSNNDHAFTLLLQKSQHVPSWMFLPWKEQIISQLVSPLQLFVLPIIKRLTQDYPNMIRESFKIMYESHSDMRYDFDIESVYEKLIKEPYVAKFYEAFDHLCQPEQYLKYHLAEVGRTSTSQDVFIKTLDQMIQKIYDNSEDGEMSMQGPLFKEILDKHRDSLLELKTVDNYRSSLQNFSDILDVNMCNRLKKDTLKEFSQLQNYSTYLSNFSFEVLDIEVPNQYKGTIKPLPQYYPKIARIESSVEVIPSKSRPIKIRIIGTNGKIYEYLIKFGRKVQQDQRIQRVFQFSNEILHVDAECKNSRLTVSTYDVLPMSSCSGLVRWISGTMSFKDLIEHSLKDKSVLRVLEKKYQEWINAASDVQPRQRSEAHQTALLKYSGKDVSEKMKELVASIDCDCLRRTFVQISSSFDCFFQLRRNFLTSYATTCLVHWIVGVGDRNLENTLVELNTGKCFGIDFTTIFGAGVDRSIPELVPFRLTPQILGLFKPYTMLLEHDAFGATMCHVLSALRREKNLVLTCLSIIVQQSAGNEGRNEGVKLLPKTKIANIKKKLNGVKPSNVMVDELSYTLGNDEAEDNQSFKLYKHIINGSELYCSSARSSVKNDDLTPEKQVFCLLDQATDMNLLGRMQSNWCPFV